MRPRLRGRSKQQLTTSPRFENVGKAPRPCDSLLSEAGSVRAAAESLWAAREQEGLNNFKGVEDEYLDTILRPDLLAYLRDVRRKGMAARCVGPRERRKAKLHPNAKRNVDQLYKQIWKDVRKHRVLVVDASHEFWEASSVARSMRWTR